jgi:AraC-like DNA-binding protein
MSIDQSLDAPGFRDIRFNTPPHFYHCEPGWSWAPAPLSDCDLWYIADGEGELNLRGERFALRSGCAFILAPEDAPRASHNPEKRLVVFAFHFDFVDARGAQTPWRRDDLRAAFPLGTMLRDRLFFEATALHCAEIFRLGDTLARHRSRLLAQQLLLHFYDSAHRPRHSHADEVLQKLVTEILQEPGRAWGIEAMARHSHLSRSQLARRFKALTGAAPNEYVICARLERAQHLLSETDMTIGHIAQALGYRDAGFFCRQFKRFNG